MRTLRYLSYRNRGLLHIEEIKVKDPSSGDIKPIFELLLFAIDDLVTCLHYSDGDSSVVSLLLSIFQLFENHRLSRFLIEYELTKEDGEIINERNRELSYEFLSFLNEENKLLQKLGLKDERESLPELDPIDLSFLKPVVDYIHTRADNFLNEEKKDIELQNVTWCSLVFSVLDVIKSKTKLPKNRDSYGSLEEPVTTVSFTLPEPQLQEEIIELPTQEETEPTTLKRATADDTAPQRSSKRVKLLSDGDMATLNSTDIRAQNFIERIDALFETIGIKLPNTNQYSSEFSELLSSWSTRYSEILIQASSDSNTEISQLFTSKNLDDQKGNDPQSFDPSTFLDQISGKNLHLVTVRKQIIKTLLTEEENGKLLISNFKIDAHLYKGLENLILSTEDLIYNEINLSKSDKNMTLFIGIYEILVNRFLLLKDHQKKNRSNKSTNDAIEQLYQMVLRWYKLISQIGIKNSESRVRFDWSTLFLLNGSGQVDNLEEKFISFLRSVEETNQQIDIGFWNYSHIPILNIKNIESQRDRLKIISSLEKTLDDSNGNESETIALIERLLLLEEGDTLLPQEKLMVEFINQKSSSLKFKLWKYLLNHYAKILSEEKYRRAFSIVLPLLIEELNGFEEKSESEREKSLLVTLGNFGTFISGYVKILQIEDWTIQNSENDDILSNVALLFKCFHSFLFSESNATSYHDTFIKQIIIDSICLISLLFKNHSKNSNEILELYLLLHDEVGALSFCDFDGGKILDISHKLLDGVESTETSEAILFQHLRCKYHVSLSSKTYIAIDHNTTSVGFDKITAIKYAGFILSNIQSRNGSIQSLSKQETNSLEILYHAIGAPDYENNTAVQVNTLELDRFLNGNLKLQSFHRAIAGSFSLDLKRAESPEFKVVENGLYFLFGLIHLNIYKARKKAAQSKILDLELIIKLFRYDLIYGTNRPESWIYLGQAYSYLAEDDLTWTSDKLNSAEKKSVTADLQKKSIICSLASLSLIINDSSNIDKKVKIQLLERFPIELYQALSKPMDGAFITNSSDKLLMLDKGLVKVNFKLNAEKLGFLFKFILKLLNFGISLKGDDWLLYYYKSKVLKKLNQQPSLVIKTILKSCKLNDTAIEPNYLLCSMLYKYSEKQLLGDEQIIGFIKKSEIFNDLTLDQEESGPNIGESWILSALKRLVSIDKKKWYHKPKARVARIYYQNKQYHKAIDEFESLVILKSTNKNLIHIWKPEFEAPGKHFVYIHDYCLFFINLLNKVADFQSLVLFSKKLRRVGTSLVNLVEVWDFACTNICNLIKEIVKAPAGYTDIEVPKLVFSEFMKGSELVNNSFEKAKVIESSDVNLLILLVELFDIRKMNNGFGSTSLIDDTFNVIYLMIYFNNSSGNQDQSIEEPTTKDPSIPVPPPSPVKVKVARKEILAAASSLAKIIEPKLKGQRITDDIKFEVPQEVIDKHLDITVPASPVTNATEPTVGTPKEDAATEDEFQTPISTPSRIPNNS